MVLKHLAATGVSDEERALILQYATSQDAIYDYQLYQIVTWFIERGDLGPELISLARSWAFDRNRSQELRCASRMALGLGGRKPDLMLLLADYAQAGSPIEQAEIVCALRKLEKGTRNSFLRRVESDNEWVSRAVAHLRQES